MPPVAGQQPPTRTLKKPSYPISPELRAYLHNFRRERPLPVTYERLRDFHETIPLLDADGRNTLWETVCYRAEDMPALNEGLKRIYALLKVDGDFSVMKHLYIDRVDFCAFGNSTPFRVRVVNAYNENQDYYYLKKADASRLYGLELEHLLSPNRLNYLTHGATLVEEHIAGIPGDVFIDRWLNGTTISPVRIAKELVKFNERCFIRLLGDMRSYNYVYVLTPDFEGTQVRIRAMDFDQQTYHGRKNYYLPQYFKENVPVVQFCLKHLNQHTAYQYQREEQTLMLQRAELSAPRLNPLLEAMATDDLAPADHVRTLAEGLAEHHQDKAFLGGLTMGALVRENLAAVRRNLAHTLGPLHAVDQPL